MAGRRYWIGTSWKMNKTLAEARAFASGLAADQPNADARIQRFVIPPFTAIREVKATLESTPVKVGAQNMHWADGGAWTGEISPLILTDCGADIVELGHSERREFFGETDETVGLKVAAALRHGLIPLICIGETARQKEEGRAEQVLAAQVDGALRYVGETGKNPELLFAYEPVWAIGDKGVPASADYAERQQERIKQRAAALLGRPVPCLYGGSVNPANCVELISCPSIDGLFIGRSAWNVNGYIGILNQCQAAL